MVALFLEQDPFGPNVDTVASDDLDPSSSFRSAGRMDYSWVRRPLRGIQIKENTYATIQVWTADNRRVGLYDSGGLAGVSSSEVSDAEAAGGLRQGWRMQNMAANFLVQRITRRQEEKLHLIETLGDTDYGFFYGQKPIQMDFQGVLMNTEDFNWRSEWWANYQEVLRGTKLVERGARIYLTYDSYTLEGYLTRSSTSETAERPYEASFQFTMWVTRWEDSSSVGNTSMPATEGGVDQLNMLDHVEESPLLATRRMNTIAFHMRSAIDAVRWGIADAYGSGVLTSGETLGQSIIDVAKQFAFGSTQNIPMVLGPDPTTGIPTPMSPAVGIHQMVASGTHFAPGSSSSSLTTFANFGQILIRGQDTAPKVRVNPKTIRGASFWLNFDEYPEGGFAGMGSSYDLMGLTAFQRDPVADAIQEKKDLVDATLKTFGNFAKYGINLYAIPVDFIYGQVQGFQSMTESATANMLRTNEEIEAQGGASLGGTDSDPLGLLGIPDTSVLEEEQEDRAAAAAAEDAEAAAGQDLLAGSFPPDSSFSGN